MCPGLPPTCPNPNPQNNKTKASARPRTKLSQVEHVIGMSKENIYMSSCICMISFQLQVHPIHPMSQLLAHAIHRQFSLLQNTYIIEQLLPIRSVFQTKIYQLVLCSLQIFRCILQHYNCWCCFAFQINIRHKCSIITKTVQY